jgi:hypothetical protein
LLVLKLDIWLSELLLFKTRVLGVILKNIEMCIENLYIKLFFNPYYVIKCINIEFEFNQKLRVFSKKRGMCIKNLYVKLFFNPYLVIKCIHPYLLFCYNLHKKIK